MITGLIIGKFIPPHAGHLDLIEFGSKRCDKLIVGLSTCIEDQIPPQVRYDWMKELTKKYKNVVLEKISDDLPRNKKPTKSGSIKWAEYCLKRFGKIDKIFSSEKYGEYMAKRLGAKNCIFDFKREKHPVSGTAIRNNPRENWKFIPDIVKPYFQEFGQGVH